MRSRGSRRSSIDDRVGDLTTTMMRADLPFDRTATDRVKEDNAIKVPTPPRKENKGQEKAVSEGVKTIGVDVGVIQEYEKQIEQLKDTFAKQVKFLEESLEKHVK